MEEKLTCRQLKREDIIEVDGSETVTVCGRTYPVSCKIKFGDSEVPIADIPVMSDEKWRTLSAVCTAKEMKKHK